MITPWRVVIVAALIGVGAAVAVSFHAPPAAPEEQYPEAQAPPAEMAPSTQPSTFTLAVGPKHITPSGLTIIEVSEGKGAAVKPGDTVAVQYRGRLFTTGQQFDSSYDRGQPLRFTVERDSMIRGFTEGVEGMKLGGKRELVIPPELGYGAAGVGDTIPPNSTLVFDVELVDVIPAH